MDFEWQNWMAKIVVTVAALWTIRYAWKNWFSSQKSGGCGGGCNCPSGSLKGRNKTSLPSRS